MLWNRAIIICLVIASLANFSFAEEVSAEKKKLYTELEQLLTGAKFKGKFTVQGKEKESPKEEEYTISSAIKTEVKDMWLLNARIQYGDKDISVPVPIEIQWAGTTPVMIMDKITLPGLGTFSTRVVLHENRYAGTWQHDNVGGHLFGTITPATKSTEKP